MVSQQDEVPLVMTGRPEMILLDGLMTVVNWDERLENEVGRSLRHCVRQRQDLHDTSPNLVS